MNNSLTDQDHTNMDAFLGHVLDAHAAGRITKADAVETLAHVMTALANDNIQEARTHFGKGRKLAQSMDPKTKVKLTGPQKALYSSLVLEDKESPGAWIECDGRELRIARALEHKGLIEIDPAVDPLTVGHKHFDVRLKQ